jgi:hypothetical protein
VMSPSASHVYAPAGSTSSRRWNSDPLWFAVFEVDRGTFLLVVGVAIFVSIAAPCATACFDSTTFCGPHASKTAFQNTYICHQREL